MYQALYRKYRPSNFNEVVGQKNIVETLKNAIVNNKISHAYLFTGPRGTGKTSIAKILAKTVNCMDNVNAIPCDVCVSCTQINNKQATDIIEIDAASNNGVDEIRDIRNKVNLVPSTGKYKIYIIDEVHMLTTGAFNALLKTLEEPPNHIIFILATTEPHKIPATILSRCQRFDFKKLTIKQITERLKYISEQEKIDITDESLLEIANISDGGMRDSINLLDQVSSYKNKAINIEDIHDINGSISNQEKIDFIDNIYNKDIQSILKKIDNYNENGKNLIKILENITITLKEILLLKIIPNYSRNEIDNYKNKLELIKNLDKEFIIDILDKSNKLLNDIKHVNDVKLAIELFMIKECSIDNNIINDESILIQKEEKIIKKEEPQKIIKEEIKIDKKIEEEKTEKINNSDNCISFEEIQKIRIENTLSRFKKTILSDMKIKFKELADYVGNPKYTKIVSLLMDGELKAASDEYILFVYDTNGSMEEFNKNILDIENFLNKEMSMKYKIISTNKISWEIIKKEFNSKTREFLYIPEDYDLNKINSKVENKNELNEYFENIIEYE
ncbi:MAG TPA: DNA polymerase III subunit gamma/tau [Bacilli bacterium]|nr:DNA polymerase III subunit gamma/tau [Bacilli bacterium]